MQEWLEMPPHGSVTETCDKGMPLLASTVGFLFYPASSSEIKSNKITLINILNLNYFVNTDYSCLIWFFGVASAWFHNILNHRYLLQKYSLSTSARQSSGAHKSGVFFHLSAPEIHRVTSSMQSRLLWSHVTAKEATQYKNVTIILDIRHTSRLLDRVLCTVLLFLCPHSVS